MDANNAPIRRRREGVESAKFEMGQKPPIDMGEAVPGAARPEVPAIEAVHAEALIDGRAEQLAFGKMTERDVVDEVVNMEVYPSSEENAPLTVPCWVNGRGAEVFLNGKWQSLGHLPVGVRLITRRKYAEVLLRAKKDKITTDHQGTEVERPQNKVHRISSAVANIQIVNDRNPKGIEWVRRCMAQPG